MQVEGWIAGAGEYVSSRIAINGIVAAAVDADTAGAWDALHDHLKIVDIVVLENEAFECY